jgi:hypothetical protein
MAVLCAKKQPQINFDANEANRISGAVRAYRGADRHASRLHTCAEAAKAAGGQP